MGRSPEDIFTAHAAALASGDPDAAAADYADDAVLLTLTGALSGRAAIREFFAASLAAMPEAEFSVGSMAFAEDALLVIWSAASPQGRITDAVDTFVFEDDRIRLQTTAFSLETSPS
jgi:uncharacterized protein (TIGR02246 family)